MWDLLKVYRNTKELFFLCVITRFSRICSQLDLFPQQDNNFGHHGPRGLGPTAHAALPGPPIHRVSVLGQLAVDTMRRLASRCIHHPNSRVDAVRMEPGTTVTGRDKVVIVLEMIDFP